MSPGPVDSPIRSATHLGATCTMNPLVPRAHNESELVAQCPVDGFEYHPGEYVSKSAFRDFFYLTGKSEATISPGPCPSCPKSK